MTAQNSSTPSNNTTSDSHNYPHQKPPSISDHASVGAFSHSLPSPSQYRSLHLPSNSDLHHQSFSPSAFSQPAHAPLQNSAASGTPDLRNTTTGSSSSVNFPSHQQQLSSQLLSTSSSITLPPELTGSTAKPPEGGGGTGSAGSLRLVKLGVAHLSLLISTLTESNYENKRKEIRELLNDSMEINNRVMRKLITNNYSYIMSSTSSRSSPNPNHRLLAETIREITSSPQDAKEKFADVIAGMVNDGEMARDFDLAVFLSHFGLDGLQKCILAVGLKQNRGNDLRNKAHEIIRGSFRSMLEALANLSKHPELKPEGIAFFIGQLLEEPVYPFIDSLKRLEISYAARSRYKNVPLPPEIFNVTEPIEQLRQQESLVHIFSALGPESTKSLETCREVLKRKWKVQISENEMTDILVLMATSRNPIDWHADVFVRALQHENLPQSFNWERVVDGLDREDFVLEGTEGLHVIFTALQHGATDPDFPIYKLWGGKWKHSRSQWSVLKGYIKADNLDVKRIPGIRKVFSSADFVSSNSSLKLMVATFETHKLISLDAVDALFHLALHEPIPPDVKQAAQTELDKAAKFTPELLLCGALMIPKPWPETLEHVINTLFNIFFEGHTSHQLVFWRLWQVDRAFVISRFIDYHLRNNLNITRILDITQELRCLNDLLEVKNAPFILDVGALAARREYLNLEKWLQEMINKHGSDFVAETYRFLRVKAEAEYIQTREGGKPTMVSLRVGPVHTFLTLLDKNHPPMTQDMQEKVTETQRLCIQAYPRLINLGCGMDVIILANNSESNTFSPVIDKEMQQNYKMMYSQETEINDMVTYLRQLKASSVPHDQDLFACMIHGLFDEYHCYPSYPLQALATTSVLFGSIIVYNLIDDIPLRVALAMVWQAVRDNEPASTMYKFGLQALVQFKERLKEWKSYCGLLAQVTGLQGTDVWRIAQDVVSGNVDRPIEPVMNGNSDQDEPGVVLTNGDSNASSPESPQHPPFRSLDPTMPFRDPSAYTEPNEEVQDRVLFIVNNVSHSNLEEKLETLKEHLREEHHQWFADYLVVERAKLEPNYHKLYLDLLDKYDDRGLTAEVLRETYVNVIKLLNAEATLNNSSERAHLKNLACWLGGLTIAKDKPIKFKNISFKDLLIEGFVTERLTVVLPFTCKVLEQSTKSTVFKPPNPWLMATIRILVELYQHVELKLNLKFEIEVLCKNLDLDIKTIEPSTDIRETRDRPAEKDENLPVEDLSLQQQEFSPASDPVPAGFADHVIVSSVVQHPSIKRILQLAIDRAIREIIGPVVERSVTIASISTSQLIQKDFATEGDEGKMRNAAHIVVQHLAGSLALVTCKDPLRMSMQNNIRALLAQSGYNEQSITDQTITVCVNDNIDMACQIIEKAAQERAVPDIDDGLGQAYQLRKRHRELRTNRPFVSPDVSQVALHLPDQFRLKPGGLSSQQLSMYEDFNRMARIPPNQESTRNSFENTFPNDFLPGGSAVVELPQVQQRASEQLPGISQAIQFDQKEIQSKISTLLTEMRKVAKECHEQRLKQIHAEHPLFQFIDAIINTASLVQPNVPRLKDALCTTVASSICLILYTDTQSQMEVEALGFLLQKVCELSPTTAKEVVMWLSHGQEDERMFNVPVTVMLLKTQLFALTHLDASIARSINAGKPAALEFLAQLLKETVSAENPFALRADFTSSLDAVGGWLKQDPTNKVALELAGNVQDSDRGGEDADLEDREKRDQIEYIFAEWVSLCQYLLTAEKNYSSFVIQLDQNKVLADTSSSCEFLRVCIEFCIIEYEQSTNNNPQTSTNCYIPIDALAKLIVLLVRYQGEGDNGQAVDKAEYLDSTLALVVFVFNHHHETRGEHFSQKVFFRFFSSMLYEYHLVENQMKGFHERILETFAECLLTIQPVFFPMFSFHWMTLVCHRYFMPKLLRLEGEKGWPLFAKLLETLLVYVGAPLKERTIPPVVKLLYRGILRVLLVLHHDFPEFLAEWHFSICEVIPVHCTQLRNLILSAYPSSLSDLPDPFTAGLKVDRLPEVKKAPKISGDVFRPLIDSGIKQLADSCLGSPEGLTNAAVHGIVEMLDTEPRKETGLGFATITVDTAIINSLVLYLGMEAIREATSKEMSTFQTQSPHTVLFSRLVSDLKPQARYFFLSAIANHLRYPNSHTHYFSYLLLYLFGHVQDKSNESDVRQQITRVLLERLIVHRPHPWGLIITLLELLKNPTYDFWQLPFIKSAPEIERLFGALFQHINNSPPRQ